MVAKSSIITVMEEAVLKAGRSLVRDFGEVENLQVSKKGPGDFVTSADHRAEQILVRELQKARPQYGFLLEEGGEIKSQGDEHRFIIDPLDGTMNFMHGVPFFSISVALERKNKDGSSEIVAGVIYAPILNDFFWAERGAGAYHRTFKEHRLLVSARTTINEALVATSMFRKDGKEDRNKDVISEMNSSIVRLMGSAALEMAYVAAGKLDAFWHYFVKPWDIAAGMLMVREAKGMVTDLFGGDKMFENNTVIASNSHLHEKIHSTVAKYYGKTAA